MTKIDNRVPAHILRRLMTLAWKNARRAAKASGAPVRTHLSTAMRDAWAEFRFVIKGERAKAKEIAALPQIPAVITAAVSDKQREFADGVVKQVAINLGRAFKELRDGVENDEQREYVDAAVARFQGAPASFWLDMRDNFYMADVAIILACRGTGIEHGIDNKAALRIAAMV